MIKGNIIVIMGVSGSGKTTIGMKLSKKIGIHFFDGDDFHPKKNIEKMKKGIPLSTGDRKPWLNILATKIEEWHSNNGAILACSALKENYRSILTSKYKDIIWVFLSGTQNLIEERLKNRQDHYMKSDLLNSQFDDLEIPAYGIHVNISKSTDKIIDEITLKLH